MILTSSVSINVTIVRVLQPKKLRAYFQILDTLCTCSVKHLDVFLDSFKMRNGRVVVVVDEERISQGRTECT
jgi:hypothetical protein